MSRIRSIHPGIWTDVEFVGLSAFARLLYIGIWNECDDKGIFLWSPLHLKMRILPADNVDAAALLAEVEAAGRIIRFTVDGKDFGAVKNFAKFQRPKKPNDIHPATPEVLTFAGHGSVDGAPDEEVVRNQLPTGGEKSPQMEDGGCNKREPKGSRPSDDARPDAVTPEMIVGAWNELAKRTGLPTIRSLTKQRKQQIAARLREYDPKAEITIAQTSDKTRSRDVQVAVNGDVIIVQRGKRVAIPYRFYLALDNAIEKIARDTDEINPQSQMPVKEWVDQPSYSYTTHRLPSDEEIAAWHKRTDNNELKAGPAPMAAAA